MNTHKILSCDQIKGVEEEVITNFFISEDLLMENAARGTLNVIKKYFGSFSSVIILCGPGNNGGDGLALGRILASKNFNVKIYLPLGPKYKSDASVNNYKAAQKLDLIYSDEPDFCKDSLVIDAIFGTGLNREISTEVEELISKLNNSGSPVVSLDIPSGINGDSGKLFGNCAVEADITVTFIALKPAHIKFPGAGYSKKVIVDTISVPNIVLKNISAPYVNSYINLPNRSSNIHKSSYGRVLTVGGSKNYFGAPYLASMASLYSGSGYSILISDQSVIDSVSSIAPEIIYDDYSSIPNRVETTSVTVLGPGLGLNNRSKEVFLSVLKANPKKLIIDGDGLTILSDLLDEDSERNIFKDFKGELVLTPHPKEMGRLLKITTPEVEADRVSAAKKLCSLTGAIVVLKGKFSVLAIPNGDVFINTVSANSLATAGSGDILSGIIAGLSGYLNLDNAVKASVYIHGLLGVFALEKIGSFGVTSTKLLELIPETINSYIDLNPQPDLEIDL